MGKNKSVIGWSLPMESVEVCLCLVLYHYTINNNDYTLYDICSVRFLDMKISKPVLV